MKLNFKGSQVTVAASDVESVVPQADGSSRVVLRPVSMWLSVRENADLIWQMLALETAVDESGCADADKPALVNLLSECHSLGISFRITKDGVLQAQASPNMPTAITTDRLARIRRHATALCRIYGKQTKQTKRRKGNA